MENSFNSSSPESSLSDKKSIFRKSTNFEEAFEVSMEESVTVVENKSEQGLDVSPKVLPFKKTRTSIPHSFSITSDDSIPSSQTEESVTFKKPSTAFLKKNKTLMDFFNVSFNETTVSKLDAFGKSFDDSNTAYNKTNPFKKINESQNEISVRDESSIANPEKETSKLSTGSGELHKQMFCSLDQDDDESSMVLTKQNPFRISKKQSELTSSSLDLSVMGEDKSVENEAIEPETTRDGDESSTLTKQNPFRISKEQSEHTATSLELSVVGEDKAMEVEAVEPETVRDESSTLLTKQNTLRMSKEQSEHTATNLELSVTGEDKAMENEAVEPETVRDESSTLLTRQNTLRMSEQQKRDSITHQQLSVLDENKSVENEAEPEIQEGDESQLAVSSTENDKSNVSLKRSQKRSMSETDFNEPDSTTYTTKQNPFKKSTKRDSLTQMQLSVTNNSLGNRTTEIQSQSSDDTDLIVTKPNPFKQKKSSQSQNSMISITEERSKENLVPITPERSHNVSVDRSVMKSANNTASYLEQSSFNDENLNNWMSDQSDEEIPPPRISSVNANLSPTKEKPPISSPTKTLSVWEQKLNEIVSNAENRRKAAKLKTNTPQKPKPSKRPEQNVQEPTDTYRPPKLIKPAPFATKKLYNYIIKKLEPKYGIDTVIESENLVSSICDTVKKVTQKKTHQKKLIQSLKKEMAEAGLIETTMDFYEFVIKFLPYSFRVKVVPCLQPVTNIVYPPKDVLNPFDKIL